MSYANRNSAPGRTGTIVAVAAIHAAAIYAIVTGLGGEVVRQIITNLPARNYQPVVPPPQPKLPEPPKPTIHHSETRVDTVKDAGLTTSRDMTFVLPPLPPGDSDGAGLVRPEPKPTAAPFKPIGARPRGNPGEWVSANDYPTRDIRQGNEGRTQFMLTIDAAGNVTGCRVIASSGHEGLDAATCLNVARRAKFEPARNDQGEPVPGTYASAIKWVIPR